MKLATMRTTLLTMLISCVLAAQGQNKTITGTVRASTGNEVLDGVSITIKGTSTGTQTNAEGKFSIEAQPQNILVVSFSGYKTIERLVGEQSEIEIFLDESSSNLDEVVVIGYGTQARDKITSAVGKLDNTILKSAPRANVGSALQGSIAGLNVVNNSGAPGASPTILLRGGASINNPGSPLVVVDGIIRAYNDISPDDIESMEVLKDAAATAIYGARANNGVILITTKHGKSGKSEVSYKYVGGYNTDRPDYTYLNAKDYIHYTRLGHLNSQRTLAEANSQLGFGLSTAAANLATFDIRPFNESNRHLLQAGWDTVGDPYGGTIIFKDHGGEVKDLVFQNTRTNDHYINVTGGNDKGKYFASFNYYDEDGVIVGSDYQRYTASLNGSYKIKKNLEISTGTQLSTATGFGLLGGDINTLYRNVSLWPTFNPWLDSAKTKPNPGNGVTDGNPQYWLDKNHRKNAVTRITVNGSVNYDITKELYVRLTGNAYYFKSDNETFTKATQTFTQVFAGAFNTNRPATFASSELFQQQYNGIVGYKKRFGLDHNLNAMLGVESFSQKTLSAQVSGTGAPTDDIVTVNASTIFTPGNNFSTRGEFRIISNFGRLNYDYDNKYLLSLVYRYDGISSLAEENRWGFFPGMSAGWNIHREKFFESGSLSSFISTLKPRISYGENGNVAGIGNYEVQGSYGSQGNYNNSLGFLNTGIINEGLTWETSKTTDIGIDVGFFKNRLTFMFDYYNRITSNLLTNLTLPSYTGFGSVRTNLGTFQNQGYELTVNGNILNSKSGVRFDASANISFNKNKITELPFNGNENNRQGGFQVYDPQSGKVIWVGGLQEGQPLGAVYGFRQLSIFQNEGEISKEANTRIDLIGLISGPGITYGQGKITPGDVNWQDVDKNDTIDTRDQVYLGNINPKFFGGFTTSLSYKGFSLFTRWDFAVGHILYNDLVARVLGNYQGTFNHMDLVKKGFSGDNSRPDIPKVYWADQVGAPNGKKNITRANNAGQVLNGNNSNFYEKGDYLACREITLSYDISKSFLAKTKVLNQARIYANLNNLFYVTGFSGNSPEPKANGIFAGNYPTPKTYAFGVQVTF